MVFKIFQCHRKIQQPSQKTGLLPVLAVTAAFAGLIWWRRHKQNASQPRRSPQEQGSKFRFPKGKAAAAGNARYSFSPKLHDVCAHYVFMTACGLVYLDLHMQPSQPKSITCYSVPS